MYELPGALPGVATLIFERLNQRSQQGGGLGPDQPLSHSLLELNHE